MTWESEYTDTEFPADKTSLYASSKTDNENLHSLVQNYDEKVKEWKRPL